MECDLLKSMVKERDEKITALETVRKDQDELLSSMQVELDELRKEHKTQGNRHGHLVQELKHEYGSTDRQLRALEREMKGSSQLHEYASLVKNAAPNQVDSNYVLRLQAQLCKAMHSMGVMESQMVVVKENCSALIKSLKDEMSGIIDDKCKMEMDLMNQLAAIHAEQRQLEDEYQEKLDEKAEKLGELKEKLQELGYHSDGEDSEGGGLSKKALLIEVESIKREKMSMENDLRNALEERTQSIQALEEETSQQTKLLDELKAQLAKKEQSKTETQDDGDTVENTVEGDEETESDIDEGDNVGAETTHTPEGGNATETPHTLEGENAAKTEATEVES